MQYRVNSLVNLNVQLINVNDTEPSNENKRQYT